MPDIPNWDTLWFSRGAYQRLIELASQAADGLETGGRLFGYSYPGRGEGVVLTVTGPGPDSRRHPTMYEFGSKTWKRDRKRHRKGSIWGVGDWHTHPTPRAEPSLGDEAGQRRFYVKHGWIWAEYLDAMVIVGVPPGGAPQAVGAWYITPDDRRPLKVRVATADWQPPVNADGENTDAVAERETGEQPAPTT